MSYSCTPPFSLEWKPESRPSYARMPGLSLHKNLNKLQGPAGKQAAQHTLMKHSCRNLLCRPFFSWIGSKLWLTSPWWRATRVIWERVIETFSSSSFFFFSQKGLYLLCRLLLAERLALKVKEQERVLVNWPEPGSRAEEALTVRAFSVFCWALPWTPCRSDLQPRPPVNIPAHPQTPTSKPSVSESNLPSEKIKFPLSSMSPDLFLLLLFESESRSVMSDSLQPHGLYSPWNSPGQNTGVGKPFPSSGDFPNPVIKTGVPHCRILYQLSHQGSPRILELVAYPLSRGSSQPRNPTGFSFIEGRFFTSWATREAQIIFFVVA